MQLDWASACDDKIIYHRIVFRRGTGLLEENGGVWSPIVLEISSNQEAY